MKRSQALTRIEQFLQDSFPPSTSYDIAAQYILEMLEEDIGMNPPYDSTSDDEDPNYCWEQE